MRVILLRKLGLIAVLCTVLAACGGGSGSETVPDTPVKEQPPTSPPPVGGTPIETGLMVAFGYNSLVAGAPLRASQIQGLAVGNGTANYRFPRSGQSISGNLTIAVDVADPDGIKRVLVGFNGSEQALVLCEISCGTTFSQTVTGVNPRNFGLTPGSLRLELWLEDQLGNRILFDARDIEWLPEPVVGVNTSRSAGALQVNWTANPSATRYNLYIAEQPGITPENILTRTGGRQFLALRQATLAVPAVDDNRRYFVLITGVDSSGESLFSEQHVVQPVGAPPFSAPIAAPDQFSLNEDEELSGVLLSNDTHPDNRSFSLAPQAVRPPDNGSLVLNADGSFVYKPVANFAGNDSFIYQIIDTQGLTAQALVSLTVLPVNDSPMALDNDYSLAANTTLTVVAPGVLANDSDIDGDTLEVDPRLITEPAHGSVLLNPDGSFNYTPTANYAGSDFFVYQVSDGKGAAVQAKVTLRIEMTNAAPIAQNDSYQLSEDEPLVVTAAEGILKNDTDPNGDSVSLVTELVSTVQNGQLILSTDGSFQYIPQQDFFGTDSFSYQIKDPAGLVSSATVLLTIVAQNDPPVVQAANFSVNSNAVLSVAAPGLLALAFDVDDEQLTLATQSVVAPTKGSVNLSANGSFSYSPNSQASGSDSFVFRVVDAKGASSTGTVVINIAKINLAPIAQNDAYELNEDGQLVVNASSGVLANDTDPDGDPISVVTDLVSTVQHGQLVLSPDGSFQYIPQQDFFGTDSFSYQIKDPAGLVSSATVLLTIVAQNDPPVVQATNFSVNSNAVLSVAAPGLLALAFDVDDEQLTLATQPVVAPTKGSVNLSANGSFTYSPNSQASGSDSFVFRVVDAKGASSTGTVVITIIYQPSAPVLADSGYQIFTNSPNGYAFAQLNVSDTDPNDTALFSMVSGNEAGLFSLSATGLLQVNDSAALAQQAGTTKTLVVQVQDSYGLIDQAVIQVQILPMPVIAQPDNYSLIKGGSLTVNTPGVLANDSESSGGTLIASLISGPAHGQLTFNSDGSFVYTPMSTFYGSDSFVYQASNGTYGAQAHVSLNITLPALQANFDAYTLNENTTLTVQTADSLLKNDVFNPNEPVVVSLVQAPPYGTLSLNTDGTFSYQSPTGAYGAYYFSYRLTQGALTSDASVELNIIPVNDAPALQDATVTISDDYITSQHVWTMALYDPDPGSYSYEILSGNTGGVFAISASGVIAVANSSLLDAGTTALYSLVVKVTENNDAGLVDTATVLITVVAAPVEETVVLSDTAFAGGANLALDMMLSGEYNDPVQIIPQSDGRSLVLGTVANSSGQEVFVVRLNADGSIDPSYADKGVFRDKIFSIYTTEQTVAGVVTSTNQLVLLVNYTESGGSGFYLIKLSDNGTLDYNFGNMQGYVLCEYSPCDSADIQATDLILNHLGHYVVSGVKDGNKAFLYEFADSGYQGGWLSPLGTVKRFDLVRQDSNHNYYGIGQSSADHIMVARISSAYALDAGTFGCDPSCVGFTEYGFSALKSKAYDAVLRNDELYVVGSITDSSAPTSSDGLFFKLTSNGSLAPGFGNASGFIQVSGNSGYPLHYQSLAVDASGFYVLTSTAESGSDMVSLSQYNLIGDFMSDQPLAVDGQLKAVDLQSDAAGLWLLNHFSHPNYGATGSVSFNWVGKYQHNTLAADTAFSADGQRWFNAGFGDDVLLGSHRLLLGSQVNKTLFYGYSYSYFNGSYQQAFIGRLTASGALDQSFGNHGLVLLATDQLEGMEIKAIAEAGSNQVYVAGYGADGNSDEAGFVLRLNQNGTLDTGFANGVFTLAPAAAGSYDRSEALKLQVRSDGHLLIGAEYSYMYDNTDIVLLQLNTDGTLDTGSFGSSAAGFSVLSDIDTASVTIERLSQMKLDPADDSVVIAGQYNLATDPQLYIARYSETGLLMNAINSPSDAFGDSGLGYSLINLLDDSNNQNYYSEYLHGLEFDAGRNLVLALSTQYESDDSYYLYRLQQNGLTDTSFNFGMPKLLNSFSDLVPVDLEIKKIQIDTAGRLLLAGTYNAINPWVGRVLLDGSGTDTGRWDPEFEPNSTKPGAYVFTGSAFSSDLFIELTSSKVTLGWSNYDAGGYSATLRRYQFYEYQNNAD